ncbi:MAG: acyl-CoA dehydrogenase family protein [Candidatus Dormibacteraeota bacterium]|nr:acyl-CoA dehydrogenase family protein [Candidatus Dormibacteraeota bacterium]
MEFAESEEQAQIRDLVRRFAEKEIAPHVAEWDRDETFPKAMNKRFSELGLLGGTLPAEYGGAELSYATMTAVIEELAYFCPMAGMACGHPSCSLGLGLLQYGSEDLKRRYLTPTLQGELVGAAAVTEPHSGTDVVRRMETTARRDGSAYVLNGAKAWISNVVNADWFLTFATIDRSREHRGVCAFIVDRRLPGVGARQFPGNVGARTFVSGEVELAGVRVPEENLIGAEGEGYKVLMAGTEIGRLACAARAVGQLRACLDLSVRYARDRTVFDEPIGRHQLVQEKIAGMSVGLEAARLLAYQLAWRKDRGATRLQKDAAIAKLFATDQLMRAADGAMQIHGAYSCSAEFDVGRIWRDAKFMQIYDGTNEIQTVMIAEHELGYRS